MAFTFEFIAIATIAIVSPSLAQFFGGRQNFPSGGFSQQAGYKVGPAWGSLSQTFDRRGYGGPLLGSPISVGAGADYLSKQGHGISGSLNVIPGVGGQGSVRGQVGLLNSGNHHVNAFAQHNRALDKNLKPYGPETNSAGINYANSNGASAFLSGSQTHGAPAIGTVGGSIPLINKGNAGVSLTGQTTFGHGMKPDHQVGIQGEIKPARHGTARHGTARHGTARHGTARHGTARHGTARHGTARHGTARHGTARHGTARHGTARHGTARHGTARHGTARHGTARHGTARHGTARHGTARHGTARHGTARHGTARHGTARHGTARHGTARHGTARHGTARHGTARHGTARHGTARHGTARHGTARHGTARHGTARHGTARHGTARHGTARHGTARHGTARHGTARHGTARHGTARHGTARHGTARHGTARHGTARHGTARHGTARHGTARHGTARHGTARHGTARHGTARHGTARHGTARHGTARHGTARHGTARHGTARHGTARHGTARHGTARHGTARHGTARHGTARHGTARHGTARQHGTARRVTAHYSGTARHSTDVAGTDCSPPILSVKKRGRLCGDGQVCGSPIVCGSFCIEVDGDTHVLYSYINNNIVYFNIIEMYEEKLILLVQKYTDIYDVSSKNYHNQQIKDNIWEEIAKEMQKPVSECKKRWASLRDSFRKSLKSQETKSGQGSLKKRLWRFDKQMTFLRPFMANRKQISNVDDSDSSESERYEQENYHIEEDHVDNVASPASNASGSSISRPCSVDVSDKSKISTSRKSKLKSKTNLSTAEVLQNYLNEKSNRKHPAFESDSPAETITKFFDCMAATVRTLSPQLQIEVKSKIFGIVSDAETRNLNINSMNSRGEDFSTQIQQTSLFGQFCQANQVTRSQTQYQQHQQPFQLPPYSANLQQHVYRQPQATQDFSRYSQQQITTLPSSSDDYESVPNTDNNTSQC
ncbi:hypothetical protein FQR65_LT05061 [Abscondita terminalis]|nr:hypothetical protein FQR65_LT05061 [Abscondita terminalis]